MHRDVNLPWRKLLQWNGAGIVTAIATAKDVNIGAHVPTPSEMAPFETALARLLRVRVTLYTPSC